MIRNFFTLIYLYYLKFYYSIATEPLDLEWRSLAKWHGLNYRVWYKDGKFFLSASASGGKSENTISNYIKICFINEDGFFNDETISVENFLFFDGAVLLDTSDVIWDDEVLNHWLYLIFNGKWKLLDDSKKPSKGFNKTIIFPYMEDANPFEFKIFTYKSS